MLLEMVEHQERFLAQQLHDTLCPNLLSLSLLTQVLIRAKQSSEEIPLSDLRRINDLLNVTIEQSLVLLQANVLSVRPDSLPKALQVLAKAAAPQVKCHFRSEGKIAISNASIAKIMYRIARESIHEIIYSNQASQVQIILRQNKGNLILEIKCDGPPSSMESRNNSVFRNGSLLEQFARYMGLQWAVETSAGTSLKVSFI
jgi:glucose-6-phosphate-specific signal transduction histidine kinase